MVPDKGKKEKERALRSILKVSPGFVAAGAQGSSELSGWEHCGHMQEAAVGACAAASARGVGYCRDH